MSSGDDVQPANIESNFELTPAKELAARFVSINWTGRANIPAAEFGSIFLQCESSIGFVVDWSVKLGTQLRGLRSIIQLEGPLLSDFDPLTWIAEFAVAPCQVMFVAGAVSTAQDLMAGYLREFRYEPRSSNSDVMLRDAAFWSLEPDQRQPGEIIEFLHRTYFRPDGAAISFARFDELLKYGTDVTKEADHVPFGSLAHAISRQRNCIVTLAPYPPIGRGRAMRVPKRHRVIDPITGEQRIIREEFVMYAPTGNGTKSTLDYPTRYAVAHELAHILLGHLASPFGVPDPREEVEAHCLAVILLHSHGAPTGRTAPSLKELDEILLAANLSPADRELVLRKRTELFSEAAPLKESSSATERGMHLRSPENQENPENPVAVSEFLLKYVQEVDYRRLVDARLPNWARV